jgi:hypothetical protein
VTATATTATGSAGSSDHGFLLNTISNLEEELRNAKLMLATQPTGNDSDDRADDLNHDSVDDGNAQEEPEYVPRTFKVITMNKSCSLRALSSWESSKKKKRRVSNDEDEDWSEEPTKPVMPRKTSCVSPTSCGTSTASENGGGELQPESISRSPKIRDVDLGGSGDTRRLVHGRKPSAAPKTMIIGKKTNETISKDVSSTRPNDYVGKPSEIKDNLGNKQFPKPPKKSSNLGKTGEKNSPKKKKIVKKSKQPTYEDYYGDSSVWDIVPDPAKEFTESKKKLNKVRMDEVADVLNHRKGTDYRGELLVVYNTGQRLWVYLHGVLQDVPNTVIKYMESVGIDYPKMGYDTLDTDLLNKDTDAPYIYIPDDVATSTTTSNNNKIEQIQGMLLDDLAAELVNCSMGKETGDDLLGSEQLTSAKLPPADTANTADFTPTKNSAPSSGTTNSDNNQDDSGTDIPFKCPFDHTDFRQLVPESDSRYCCNGSDYDGVKCATPGCNKQFVHHCPKGSNNCFKPTDKHPLYACVNRRDKCPFAICFQCQSNFLLAAVKK